MENVNAPIINELPLFLKCGFGEYQDKEFCFRVVGKVVNVSVDEKVMRGDTVGVDLLNAIAFDPFTHGYYEVKNRVGNAFKDDLELKK